MMANSAEVDLAEQGKKAWQLKLMAESALILRYGCEHKKEPDLAKIFLLLTLGSDGDALWRGEERTAGKGLAFGGMPCLRAVISRVGCRYLSDKNLWMARPLLLALVPTSDLDV